MISEKRIEENLRIKVQKIGGKALKFVSPSVTGVPDRIVLLPGARIHFIELKAPKGVLSPRQKVVQKELTELGFTVKTISNMEQLNDFINGV